MSKSSIGRRRAGISSLATTALVLGAAVAGAGAASADATFAFTRIAGIDRYDTAARAADAFDPNANDVILANGVPGSYADALSANYLAGVRNDPILLTRKDVTPAFTLNQLSDSGVENITIVGGTGVVSAAQATSLTNAGYTVDRISGLDRYKTNADIIAAGGAADNIGVIATGLNFPDALGAGPVAFDGHALGLSRTNDIDNDVVAALDAAGVTSVLVLGGPTVVGPAVLTELAASGITLEARIFGADRSETSTDLADYAIANFGFVNTQVNVASGYANGSGADALAGGPLTGQQNRAMLVTRDVNNVGDLDNWLTAHAATLTGTTSIIFGGTGAVSAAAQATMTAAARAVSTNADFTPTPGTDTTLTVVGDDDPNVATDDRTYTVNGLDNTKAYTVALFPCANVTKDANGVYTFADADGTADKADGEGTTTTSSVPEADITRVNNAVVTATDTAQAVPVNGTINFTIDGAAPGCVVPVVYLNAGGAGLDLNAANQPTELFGVGGKTTYNAFEAAAGGITDSIVDSVDKAGNTFTASGDGTANSYNYDANDSFSVGGISVGLATFEAALSTGDGIGAGSTYATDPAGVSNFKLLDTSPAAPTSVEAEKGGTAATTNDITVTVDTTPAVFDSIVIQRAPVTGGTDELNDGTIGAYVTVAQPTTDAVAGGDFQYVDNNVAVGTYRYRAAFVKDGDQGAYQTDDANETSTAPVSDGTAPTAADTRVSDNDGSNPLLLQDGEAFTVVFSEVMAAPTANDTIRVQDADGSVYDLINAGPAVVYTLNSAAVTIGGTEYPAGRVLTVAITTLPAASAAGAIGGLGIPSTITLQSGTTDAAGNAWNLAGSADLSVDSE